MRLCVPACPSWPHCLHTLRLGQSTSGEHSGTCHWNFNGCLLLMCLLLKLDLKPHFPLARFPELLMKRLSLHRSLSLNTDSITSSNSNRPSLVSEPHPNARLTTSDWLGFHSDVSCSLIGWDFTLMCAVLDLCEVLWFVPGGGKRKDFWRQNCSVSSPGDDRKRVCPPLFEQPSAAQSAMFCVPLADRKLPLEHNLDH